MSPEIAFCTNRLNPSWNGLFLTGDHLTASYAIPRGIGWKSTSGRMRAVSLRVSAGDTVGQPLHAVLFDVDESGSRAVKISNHRHHQRNHHRSDYQR